MDQIKQAEKREAEEKQARTEKRKREDDRLEEELASAMAASADDYRVAKKAKVPEEPPNDEKGVMRFRLRLPGAPHLLPPRFKTSSLLIPAALIHLPSLVPQLKHSDERHRAGP
jgi:hypothetical protein